VEGGDAFLIGHAGIRAGLQQHVDRIDAPFK
jgi:hypothetical protein